MKSLKSPQGVIIIFLTLFIVACCFFIVRIEIKAASLQSQWDEHQKSLKNNEDVLSDLNQFVRYVKNGSVLKLKQLNLLLSNGNTMLILDAANFEGTSDGDISFGSFTGNKKYFGYDSKSKTTFMRGVGNGDVFVRSNNGENYLRITDDMVSLNAWDKNKRMVGLDIMPSSGRVDITTGGGNRANISLEQEDIFMNSENEISFEGKILKMVNASGKCKIIMRENDIQIVCTPSKGPIIGISFNPSVQSIDIDAGDASIILAKDEIHFFAEGDINITSKNGNVNIEGKKVRVNE